MLPVIELGPRLDDIYIKVERLLAQGTEGPLYILGGSLVFIDNSGHHAHTVETIRLLLSTLATFQVATPEGKIREVPPPTWLARAVLDKAHSIAPKLSGSISMPLFVPPGNIVSAGYHVPSGLFVRGAPRGLNSRAQPIEQGMAGVAMDYALEPWSDFPFTGDRDRSVLLALIVTILLRHNVYGPVPIFGISAPVMGTGKTIMVEMVGMLTLGKRPSTMLPTRDENEMRKRILAIALKAHRFVLLDNVEGELRSPSLAAAVTGQRITDRILGKSEVVDVDSKSVWAITGNSLIIGGDLERRALMLRIDAGMAHPGRRRFARTPECLAIAISARRASMLRKIFSCLAGFYTAGAPRHLASPLGSFEAWDSVVRSFVVWCGLVDPVIEDQPHADLDLLLNTWYAILGDQPMSVTKLMEHVSPSLQRALPKERDTASMGRALSRSANIKSGKHTLQKAGRGSTGMLWKVTTDK